MKKQCSLFLYFLFILFLNLLTESVEEKWTATKISHDQSVSI